MNSASVTPKAAAIAPTWLTVSPPAYLPKSSQSSVALLSSMMALITGPNLSRMSQRSPQWSAPVT